MYQVSLKGVSFFGTGMNSSGGETPEIVNYLTEIVLNVYTFPIRLTLSKVVAYIRYPSNQI